jgi:UDP-2,3-diacylglucosamine pyrophosphatase LpxH
VAISIYPLIKKALKKELRNAPEVKLADKVIIISDLHLGLKNGADNFKQCEATLLHTLKIYANKSYELIILGDTFELWENNNVYEIIKGYNHLFNFIKNNYLNYYIIAGNHDKKILKCDIAKTILAKNIYQSIKCNNILITHGHKGEIEIPFARYFVKWLGFLQNKDYFNSRHLPRRANSFSIKHCNNLYKAQAKLGINLICGHTHNPRIERVINYVNTANNTLVDGSYYANTGCFSFLDGSGTLLELDVKNNIPSLIKVSKDLTIEKSYG